MRIDMGNLMERPQLIAGLELGRRRFIMVVGHLFKRQRVVVRTVQSVPAQGIHRGTFTDPTECTDAVARLMRQVEQSLGDRVHTVLVALHGNHLKGINASASIPIRDPGGGIARRDMERVVSTCRTLSLSYDRKILHTFERSFAVDGQSGIKDPVGLYGTKLGVELHLVTALNLAVQNLVKVLNRAGLEVEELVLPGLAAAEAVLSDLDRDLGVTLIRIGELQTEALLFTDGAVRETLLVPWGTEHLTEYLGRTLRLPWAAAEQLWGQVQSLDGRPEWACLPLQARAGSWVRTFPQGQVAHLLSSRSKDFLLRLRRRLDASPYFRESASGVVIVGDLAHVEGFLEVAEGLLNMPVRLGTVRALERDPQVTLGSVHTTAIGLLCHAARQRAPVLHPRPAPLGLRWIERVRRLLDEYF
jgi:cell division protein FtsA